VEEREWSLLYCYYYQYNCCSSVAVAVDEQQQQQQHDCIDVHILPYPTIIALAYLHNALDILTLVERRRQQQTL
jgi:hypothetical protein